LPRLQGRKDKRRDKMGRGKLPKYPTAAFAAAGAPEKPFQGPDLDTPCRETKVRALRSGDSPGP
jgi:hypothetical protein